MTDNRFNNVAFLINLAAHLQDGWQPGQENRYPPESRAQMALLEEMALRNNVVYSLFDFEKYHYVFHTRNLFSLIGLPQHQQDAKWNSTYLSLIEDHRPVETFLALRKQCLAMLPSNLKHFRSTACGAYAVNLNGQRLRGCYQARPLTYNSAGNVKLSFDSVFMVNELMVPQPGYWIRFATDTHVYHWHSHTEKLVSKDILSPREIEFITSWKSGLSIPIIADQANVSPYTVKNQLTNARQRMLARDNTALAQLCTLTGILSSPF